MKDKKKISFWMDQNNHRRKWVSH